MLPELAAVAATQNGVFLRRQAVQLGYTDDEIGRLVRRGEWRRLRRGAYCESALLAEDTFGDSEEFLRTQACALVLQPPAFASHSSALSVHNLPRWGTPSGQSHFTRPLHHAGRHEAGVVHHEANLSDAEKTTVRGVAVTGLERTALDVSREFGFAPGLVAADAATNRGADKALLLDLATRMTAWPGARAIQSVTRLVDPGAQTPGETLTRIAAIEAGLGELRTQFEVRTATLHAFVDIVAPEYNLALEFDGRQKYRRTRDAIDTAVDDAEIVWAEKQREDLLSDHGFEVLRVIWPELFGSRRVRLLQRMRDGAERGRRRSPGIAALVA